jgi:hypothetical protein
VTISGTMVLLLLVATCVVTWTLQHFLTQYVLPADSGQVAYAKTYRVHRRYWESVRSWEARTVAASKALRDALDAFVAESERLGRLQRVSYTGVKWSLPSGHPLAIAVMVARYPDGPTLLEWERVGGGEVAEAGVDWVRAFDSAGKRAYEAHQKVSS